MSAPPPCTLGDSTIRTVITWERTGPREHLVTIERDYGWWRGAWNVLHGLPLTHAVRD